MQAGCNDVGQGKAQTRVCQLPGRPIKFGRPLRLEVPDWRQSTAPCAVEPVPAPVRRPWSGGDKHDQPAAARLQLPGARPAAPPISEHLESRRVSRTDPRVRDMGTRQCAAPRAARGCGCGVSEAICREADPSPADPTPITSNYDHSALTPTTAITAALLSADAVGYDAPALRMKYTKAQAQHLEVRCACDRRSKRQQMGDANARKSRALSSKDQPRCNPCLRSDRQRRANCAARPPLPECIHFEWQDAHAKRARAPGGRRCDRAQVRDGNSGSSWQRLYSQLTHAFLLALHITHAPAHAQPV